MIKNRLAVLLAERNLKITQVAKDTGISRNTITSTAQNDSKMIQLQTIDVLCNYLGITPADFFEYYPAIYDISIFIEDFEMEVFFNDMFVTGMNISNFSADIYLDLKFPNNQTYSFSLEADFINSSGKFDFPAGLIEDKDLLELQLKFANEDDKKHFKDNIWNDMSIGIQSDLFRELKEMLIRELRNYLIENPTKVIKSGYSSDFEKMWQSELSDFENYFILNFASLLKK